MADGAQGSPSDSAELSSVEATTDTSGDPITHTTLEQAEPSVAAGPRRRSGSRVWIWRGVVAAGVLILLYVAWVGFRAYQAYHHLSAAKSIVAQLQAEVEAEGVSHPERLADLTTRLRDEASSAEGAVSDPLYRAATSVPWVGDNLEAVGQVSWAVGVISDRLPQVAAFATELTTKQLLHDGAVNIELVSAGARVLTNLDDALRSASSVAAAIDRRHLIGPVDQVVAQLQGELPKAAALTGRVANVARIAAPMLGADGTRTYLVVFQNLAEPRATGGIFGSYVLLRVDQGKLTLLDQGSSSRDIGIFDAPVGAMDQATLGLYGDRIGTYPMDVNFTPDFPSAAARFAAMYKVKSRTEVDGVVALDPVVVATLLDGADSIRLSDGTELTAKNIVRFLLSDLYAKFPQLSDAGRRDAYTAAATSSVFSSIMTNPGELKLKLSAVKKLVTDRRLMVWSASDQEESALLATPVSGRLPVDTVDKPIIGLFLNDGTGGKLGYYLDGSATLTPGSCATGGGREVALSAKLTDSSPPAGLSPYVLGGSNPDYSFRLNVLLFAPTGGTVSDLRIDGRSVPVLTGNENGRSVFVATVELGPGQSATITATVNVPAAGTSRVYPQLISTPGVRSWGKHTEPFAPCE